MRQKKDGDVLSASVGRCELRSVSRVIWTAEKEKVKNVLTKILIVCIMNIPLVCRRKLWREINIQRRRESG